MKYLLLLLLLIGCTMEARTIKLAVIACRNHGGLSYIRMGVKDIAICGDKTRSAIRGKIDAR